MSEDIERATEAVERAIPTATCFTWTVEESEKWLRQHEARRRWLRTPAGRWWLLWDRVKWRYLSTLVEPILQRIASYFDWYLET